MQVTAERPVCKLRKVCSVS